MALDQHFGRGFDGEILHGSIPLTGRQHMLAAPSRGRIPMRPRRGRTAPGSPSMRQNAKVPLDRHDREILARYQHDTQVPAKVIADAVGLSAAAVQRRLKRLRAEGVIERELAQLDPKALGLPVTCVVTVDLERERGGDLERFRRKVLAAPRCSSATT
jgi:DNA-binding transcriptional ArsR family regulator